MRGGKLKLLQQAKDNAGLLSVLGGFALVAASWGQLEKIGWLIGVPAAAYEGKELAMETKDNFERYLERQDAVAEALQAYVAQQQQMPMQQAPALQYFQEYDQQGTCWSCSAYSYDSCWSSNLWRPCQN